MISKRPIVQPGGPSPAPSGTDLVGHMSRPMRPTDGCGGTASRFKSRVGYALARWWDRVGPGSDDFFFVLEESEVIADLEYGRD